MGNPKLEIDLRQIRANAAIILGLCRRNGIEATAVVKGYNAIDAVTEAIVDAGFRSLGSSRLPHLRAVKARGYPVKTMALRVPMLSEVEELIACADISLCSESATIAQMDREAGRRRRTHEVILMRDIGDLREGIFDEELFIETACNIERECANLVLKGIGTNLSCYGSIRPTRENLSQLVRNAGEIERRIGRRLEVVSGGGSTSLPLLLAKTGREMPAGITHMRIGGAILLRSEIPGLSPDVLPGLADDTLTLRAEIIEIGSKPTHPIGELGIDCFGNRRAYCDRGVRRRALLAVGAFDVGDCRKLEPVDPGVEILGASSDHMIADIHDAAGSYELGGTMAFRLQYQAMLFATGNDLVEKCVREETR